MIIVFEGGDQAGKKTQSALLQRKLKSAKIKATVFSFPDYSTPIGKEISKYLHGKRKFPPQVIHCLLAANRWEKLDEIKKAQQKNSIVIMNRYSESNLVYGLVNGLKLDWLENLDFGLPKSDLVILLDVPQIESFSRKRSNRDRFEKDKNFAIKISKTYRKIAVKKRWRIVDATKSNQAVHEDIMKIFRKKIGI